LNSSGRRDETRPHFIQAWETARAAGLDGLAVDAAHMLGIVEPPDEAVQWNETALTLAEASDDPDARRWRGSLCNNLGWTHHGRGDHATALDYFERALEHRIAAGKPKDVRIARWCLARCLRSLDRVEAALDMQRDLEPDAGDDGFVPEEIGECLLALDRAEEARVYFARAHALLSAEAGLAEAEPERLARLTRLGGVEPD
jgi:tetratricopeptide (TPR) repeat protein